MLFISLVSCILYIGTNKVVPATGEKVSASGSNCDSKDIEESIDGAASDDLEGAKNYDNMAETFSSMSLKKKGPMVVVMPF